MDYKEKLERAKELYQTANADQKYVLESLFPELAESEDERIKKEILNVFKQLGKDTTLCGRNYDYAKWIAWLEKQEQKKCIDDLTQQEAMDIAVAKCFEQGEQNLANSAKTCKKSQRMISAKAKEALYSKTEDTLLDKALDFIVETQEDKELLIKDLCGRLPYGVFCDIYNEKCTITEKLLIGGLSHFCDDTIAVRPYLRPMSSMTEEERKDLLVTVVGENAVKYFQVLPDGSIDNTDVAHQDLEKFIMHWINFDSINTTSYIDWLNAHHFDVRNLIEKGLALEAPDGMYGKEKQ